MEQQPEFTEQQLKRIDFLISQRLSEFEKKHEPALLFAQKLMAERSPRQEVKPRPYGQVKSRLSVPAFKAPLPKRKEEKKKPVSARGEKSMRVQTMQEYRAQKNEEAKKQGRAKRILGKERAQVAPPSGRSSTGLKKGKKPVEEEAKEMAQKLTKEDLGGQPLAKKDEREPLILSKGDIGPVPERKKEAQIQYVETSSAIISPKEPLKTLPELLASSNQSESLLEKLHKEQGKVIEVPEPTAQTFAKVSEYSSSSLIRG